VTGYLFIIPTAYLLGSVPFGLIAGRLSGGVDIREHGSGRMGMTNVLRTVGLRVAIPVLLLDMGKSVLAITLARVFFDSPGVDVAAALAAVAGHNWPVFVGFKGGRGTAPAWGALIILSPVAGLVATVLGASILALFRYVSLGSLLGAGSGAVVLIALSVAGVEPMAYAWYGAIGGPLIFALHMDNIARLIRGSERKLGQQTDKIGSSREARKDKVLRWPKSA
jgi:glycerol-3-phosphate acyltransferase PlsY